METEMLITQRLTVSEVAIEFNNSALSRELILEQCESFNEEQKKVVFKTLIESGQFHEAVVVASVVNGGSSLQCSGSVAQLCMNLDRKQRIGASIALIEEGFYNVAAEIAESDEDVSFKDDVYGEISNYAAEKNDIFLVKQFAGAIQKISKKDETLERSAKIIAEKGPRWVGSYDLKEITSGISDKGWRDKLASDFKELIANRKV